MAPVPIIIFDSYGRQENTDGQKRRGKKKDAMYDIYSSLIPTYTHTHHTNACKKSGGGGHYNIEVALKLHHILWGMENQGC